MKQTKHRSYKSYVYQRIGRRIDTMDLQFTGYGYHVAITLLNKLIKKYDVKIRMYNGTITINCRMSETNAILKTLRTYAIYH